MSAGELAIATIRWQASDGRMPAGYPSFEEQDRWRGTVMFLLFASPRFTEVYSPSLDLALDPR